jgi:hypothetical protein
VFLGDRGYGKSTLGAALLARGFPILTDDVVVVDVGGGQWTVHPGVPRIKLFPSVQRELLGSDFAGSPNTNARLLRSARRDLRSHRRIDTPSVRSRCRLSGSAAS